MHGSIGIVTQIELSCDAMALKRKEGVQEQILGPLEAILSSLLTMQSRNSRDERNYLEGKESYLGEGSTNEGALFVSWNY